MTEEEKFSLKKRIEKRTTIDDLDVVEIVFDEIDKTELTSKRPHGEWIPCSERLPEEDGKYLVTSHVYIPTKPIVTTSIFVASTKEFYPNCIAWMPLPEPYKKEGEEQ